VKTTNTLSLVLFVVLFCTVASFGQQGGGGVANTHALSLPGKDWSLELSLPNFAVRETETSPDGRARRFYASNERDGYHFSVAISPAAREGDGKVLRALALDGLSQSPFKMDDLKQSEYREMPTVEYLVKEFRGQQVNQKHFNAYISRDGAWIDIHLSKMLFKEGDEKMFYSILDSVRFVEGAKSAAVAVSSPALMEQLGEGSRYFMQGDFKKAIAPYREALELEKKSPQLDKNLWRVLIDNLGMSYGITGDLKSARETFEYGLSKDPTYPMFHYNMACTYAEMDDLDNAIASLKKAFAYKQNMIPGEEMPDPSNDDSFKRFSKNEKFRAALKEIGR
jgi:tetratricopeptide (TPR) repeat protein